MLSAKGMSSPSDNHTRMRSPPWETDGIEVYTRALTQHGSSRIRTAVCMAKVLEPFERLETIRRSGPLPQKDGDQGVEDCCRECLAGANLSPSTNQYDGGTGSKAPIRTSESFWQSHLASAESLMRFEEYGFDLLIDEDPNVRACHHAIISELRRQPGWLKIMERSLLDDEYVIQRAAMEALLAEPVRGLSILKKYL